VASTQGQLTSTVRDIQRLLGAAREDLNTISFKLDEVHLDQEKPLLRPVGRKITYTPKKDIGSFYANKVIYGAGAGLDRLNADVRILQFKGAGMLSAESAGEQIDFISDPVGEQEKVQREAVESAALQKFLQDAPVDQVMSVYLDMNDGDDFPTAVKKTLAEAQAAQQAAAPAPVPVEAQGPATQQLALQKGAAPGGGAPVQFTPPPLENILVGK
jgi:hypothetical protein